MSEKVLSRFHLPFPLFDSHFHALHTAERHECAPVLLQKAFEQNLEGAMEVAIDEHCFQERLQTAAQYSRLRLSAGIHPSSTHPDRGNWNERFALIKEQSTHPLVKAIGETGLDFYREHSPREAQIQAFADHLELAAASNLPIIIHCRNAAEEVLESIKNSNCRHGIFHCFSEGPEVAEKALELGFHISFAGNITYKNTEQLARAARIVPQERILVETDAPYLAPQPVRGRPNHPGYIGYTLEALAKIRNEEPAQLAEITLANTRKLFS